MRPNTNYFNVKLFKTDFFNAAKMMLQEILVKQPALTFYLGTPQFVVKFLIGEFEQWENFYC